MLTVVVLCCLFAAAQAYPGGAADGACTNSALVPTGHPDSVGAADSPFTVTASSSSYMAGGATVEVTISSDATNTTMEGFLVVALPADDADGAAVGSFSVLMNDADAALSQGKCSGGSTHTQAFHDTTPSAITVTLAWNPPATGAGNIKFYATVVHEKNEYWVKLPSSEITDNSPEAPTTTVKTTTATSSVTTTNFCMTLGLAGILLYVGGRF